MTHESLSNGISSVIETKRDIPIQVIYPWLEQFLQHKCIKVDIESADHLIKAQMNSTGAILYVECPIFAGKVEPIGFIGGIWTKGWTPKQGVDLEKRIRQTAENIDDIMQSYNEGSSK